MKKKSVTRALTAPLTAAAALCAAITGGGMAAWGMGAPTPPPPPVQVERAAPARPAHPAAPARVDGPVDGAPDVPAAAQPVPGAGTAAPAYLLATEVSPDDLRFRRRVVVVFADTPSDPAFGAQMRALAAQAGPLKDRDVVVVADSDPAAGSIWRQQLNPHGFSLVVIDKDGQVKQRKPAPWDVREIVRAIDKFPLRRQETGRRGALP